MPSLAEALNNDIAAARIVYGIVATVSPITVTVAPSTVAVACAAITSYVPIAGQKVVILEQGADRIIVGPSDGATLARPGIIARPSSATSQTGIAATPTDLDSLSAAWTAPGGRVYRITVQVRFQQVSANGAVEVSITDGAGTVQNRGTYAMDSAGPNNVTTAFVQALVAPSAGSVGYKARISTTAGTVSTQLSATQNSLFIVEDICPT